MCMSKLLKSSGRSEVLWRATWRTSTQPAPTHALLRRAVPSRRDCPYPSSAVLPQTARHRRPQSRLNRSHTDLIFLSRLLRNNLRWAQKPGGSLLRRARGFLPLSHSPCHFAQIEPISRQLAQTRFVRVPLNHRLRAVREIFISRAVTPFSSSAWAEDADERFRVFSSSCIRQPDTPCDRAERLHGSRMFAVS